MDQNERRETAGDHVISMYFRWTCPVDQNEREKLPGTMQLACILVGRV